MNFDWSAILSNAKFLLLQGLVGIGVYGGGTLRLASPAILLGFVVGIILGLARLANRPWIHYPAVIYIELIRGVPLVIVIFWFWFLVPVMIGRPVPEYWVALTAFVMFEGAYIGEIIRAGIQSVAKGQVEAATASGLSYGQMMYDVLLPQAIRNMIPALVTQFIVLFKDTSLASIIGMMDLTKAAQIVSERELRPFEMYLFIAAVYWVFTYSMSRLARRLEIRMSPDRRP